jgi:hypothetical protein
MHFPVCVYPPLFDFHLQLCGDYYCDYDGWTFGFAVDLCDDSVMDFGNVWEVVEIAVVAAVAVRLVVAEHNYSRVEKQTHFPDPNF